ncbi:MAG: double-strand break repair helicase AddA [Pseudomonadota bacterium]|nr:double-strand break repair helicase AddA [Pseudomonadota bacterium]
MNQFSNQTIASTPSASVWVSASAGSGKTKVLADRVLRLLLNGTGAEKILCLTFTRAAAAEMENRIRELLGEWATLPHAELVGTIAALTNEVPGPPQIRLARRLFAEVLDAPSGIMIQTIHSFCESLLGRFPVEAGLAPYFEVMDERTASEALLAARDQVLARAHQDKGGALAEALQVVTRWVHEDEFADLMIMIASNRGRLRRLIVAHTNMAGATAAARQFLEIAANETVEAVLWEASNNDVLEFVRLGEAVNMLAQGGMRDRERGETISTWLHASRDERTVSFDAYGLAYLTGTGSIRASLASKRVVQKMPELLDVLQREANRVYAVFEKRKAIMTAEATQAILELATKLIDRYEAYKKQNAVLDYDDLILKARALVEGAAPWVLYKLDGGIDHILIDEAQDSNPDQWAVVRAIIEEFYSGEGARELTRTVFAVGDEKQSIFSFQGAVPGEFADMGAYLEPRAVAAGRDWHRVPLDVSFRSASAILKAVDAVFECEHVRSGVSVGPINHTAYRRGQGGLVEVWPPVTPDERLDTASWSTPEAIRNLTTPARRLAHAIATRIATWMRDGEILTSAGRPVRPGDIMVLVRRRTDFVDNLIQELKKTGVPVAGLDRMVLTEQLAVRDLIALGKFALLPYDEVNLAAVLKGPLIGFDENQLFQVCHGRRGSVWGSLRRLGRTDQNFGAACATLSEVLARADVTPPYEFFAHILGAMGARARLLARLREEANDPVDEFLALALAFEKSHPPSLQGFLYWLEQGEAEIKRDLDQGTRDEVRIMTVHGAKGLQAPIVFLADTMQVPQRDAGFLWKSDGFCKTSAAEMYGAEIMIWPPRSRTYGNHAQQLAQIARRRQDEEYRRLLYVAMTRAEDRLYVTGYGTHQKAPDNAWWNLIFRGLEGCSKRYKFESHPETVDKSDLVWRGEGLRLTSPQKSKPDTRAGPRAVSGRLPDLPCWVDKDALTETVPMRLAPSRAVDTDLPVRSPSGADGGFGFQRGLLVHRLLQMLPEIAADNRRTLARDFLTRPGHGLSENQVDEILAETLNVLNDPACDGLFGLDSKAEVSVAGVLNGVAVSGRIDRLLVTETKIKVLDFKTNRTPPRNAQDIPELYLRQMAAYRSLLQRIYKKQLIECILVWTAGPVLTTLDAKAMDMLAP